MDYSKCFKEVLLQYSFNDPITELIRHNENITYKVVEKETEDTYLLRIHKPITKNMEGVHNTYEAIQCELTYLLAWASQSEFPVQIPIANRDGELVTTVIIDGDKVHCSILKWINGEIMSKKDLNNEKTVSTLGQHIAFLHQFSQHFHPSKSFKRPEYGLDWTNSILTKLQSGNEIGVITNEEYRILESMFSLINDRMKVPSKTIDTWGFIHADINYSNLINTMKGISFIDFGLSGFGYYAMDVAMGALLTEKDLRDVIISGYTSIIPRELDIEQLESFMFLAIVAYYAFLVSNKNQHIWIRKNISGLIDHFCKPFLNGKMVFYDI